MGPYLLVPGWLSIKKKMKGTIAPITVRSSRSHQPLLPVSWSLRMETVSVHRERIPLTIAGMVEFSLKTKLQIAPIMAVNNQKYQ